MKKNMKNLLVFVMAFMPSLAINTFAQPSGDDPEIIPVKETPSPHPGTGPRIMKDGHTDIPVTPAPNPNPFPNPHGGGPRIAGVDPDVIPIKPKPGDDLPGPRVASVEPEEIPIISLPIPGPRLGKASVEPEEIPVRPIPGSDPRPRLASNEPIDPPIVPAPGTGSDSDPLPRLAYNEPTDIPVIPNPTTNPGTGPRIRKAAYYLDLILFNGNGYFGKYLIG